MEAMRAGVRMPVPLEPFVPPSRRAWRPVQHVKCQLCDFQVPVDEADALRLHFDQEHPLAAPNLKHFVELQG
jgi:hypothetical protein